MPGKIVDYLLSLHPVTKVLSLLRKVYLPGFQGLNIYEVATFFFRGIMQGALSSRASSISFQFFLAIFPAILFFFSLIPYIPVQDFEQQLMGLLAEIIPENAYITIESTIRDIITKPRSGLLSLGFVMALYFSTNGILSMVDAFNRTVNLAESRKGFRQRLISVFLVLLLVLITIVAILLITFGTLVMNFLSENGILVGLNYYYLLQTGKWIVIVALIYFAISFLFYFALQRNARPVFSAG